MPPKKSPPKAKAKKPASRVSKPLQEIEDANAAALDARVRKAKEDSDRERNGSAIAKAIVAAVLPERAPDKGAELTKEDKAALKEEAKRKAESARKQRLEKNGGTPLLYYSRLSKDFWIRKPQGFRTYDKADLKNHLIAAGCGQYPEGDGLSEIDRVFLDSQNEREMDYIGSLPGYRIGTHVIDGRRMLVTDEADAAIWSDPPKDPVQEHQVSFLIEFFSALLHDRMQDKYLMNAIAVWLRSIRRAALHGNSAFRPLPFMAIVGKAKHGKSTLQGILTRIFGGRADNPAKAMLEGEKFTAPLIRAEHWTFGDPPGTTQLPDRLFFGDKIKEFAHELYFVFRGMQKEGFKVPCFRWVDGSFNDHENDLRKFPPMRDGLTDKISLKRCSDARPFLKDWSEKHRRQQTLTGFDSADGIDWPAVQSRINAEVPLFRHWLLQTFQTVPECWADMRGGVAAFHHSGLLKELGELSPQANFLMHMDDVIFKQESDASFNDFEWNRTRHDNWKEEAVSYPFIVCTALEMQKRLKACQLPRALEDRLSLIGRDLGDLSSSHPHRISKATSATNRTGIVKGIQLWKITNPFFNQPSAEE